VLSRTWGLLLLALLCWGCAGPDQTSGSRAPADPPNSISHLQFPSATLALPAPTRIRVPALQIDTLVVPVGLESDGAMAMPDGFDVVGWYSQGAIPGSPGRSTLSGHFDSKSGPAIFFTLSKLKPNNLVHVELGPGQMVADFRITQIVTYVADQVPLDQVFGPADNAQLVLITCTGSFDRKKGSYTERLVVYAELVGLK